MAIESDARPVPADSEPATTVTDRSFSAVPAMAGFVLLVAGALLARTASGTRGHVAGLVADGRITSLTMTDAQLVESVYLVQLGAAGAFALAALVLAALAVSMFRRDPARD